jgi:hypothetical protein
MKPHNIDRIVDAILYGLTIGIVALMYFRTPQ